MFGFRWLIRRLKKRMTPIPQQQARLMANRIALLYAFFGWQFVAVMIYLTWKKNIPDGPDKLRKYLEILDADQAQVLRFEGFTKVADYDLYRTKEVEQEILNRSRQAQITDSINYGDEIKTINKEPTSENFAEPSTSI